MHLFSYPPCECVCIFLTPYSLFSSPFFILSPQSSEGFFFSSCCFSLTTCAAPLLAFFVSASLHPLHLSSRRHFCTPRAAGSPLLFSPFLRHHTDAPPPIPRFPSQCVTTSYCSLLFSYFPSHHTVIVNSLLVTLNVHMYVPGRHPRALPALPALCQWRECSGISLQIKSPT